MSAALVEFARAALSADGVPADHLAVTSGALDGIERVLTAHLRPVTGSPSRTRAGPTCSISLPPLAFRPSPFRSTTTGHWPADMARALDRGVRGVIITNRAQNPTGAALSADRADALRQLLAHRAGDLLLVEDDHCAGISGAPLHTLAGATRHWAFVRSASKAYGPDLRVAVLAGDHRTVERVHGRLRLGPGWVSHLLQDLAVSLWSDRTLRSASSRRPSGNTPTTASGYPPPWPGAASPRTRAPGSTCGSPYPTRRSRSPDCSARAGPRRPARGSGWARRRASASPSRTDRRRNRTPGGCDRRGSTQRGPPQRVGERQTPSLRPFPRPGPVHNSATLRSGGVPLSATSGAGTGFFFLSKPIHRPNAD